MIQAFFFFNISLSFKFFLFLKMSNIHRENEPYIPPNLNNCQFMVKFLSSFSTQHPFFSGGIIFSPGKSHKINYFTHKYFSVYH